MLTSFLLFAAGLQEPGPLATLRAEFEAARGRPRFVAVLSPT